MAGALNARAIAGISISRATPAFALIGRFAVADHIDVTACIPIG
jgi:hypothetical protein